MSNESKVILYYLLYRWILQECIDVRRGKRQLSVHGSPFLSLPLTFIKSCPLFHHAEVSGITNEQQRGEPLSPSNSNIYSFNSPSSSSIETSQLETPTTTTTTTTTTQTTAQSRYKIWQWNSSFSFSSTFTSWWGTKSGESELKTADFTSSPSASSSSSPPPPLRSQPQTRFVEEDEKLFKAVSEWLKEVQQTDWKRCSTPNEDEEEEEEFDTAEPGENVIHSKEDDEGGVKKETPQSPLKSKRLERAIASFLASYYSHLLLSHSAIFMHSLPQNNTTTTTTTTNHLHSSNNNNNNNNNNNHRVEQNEKMSKRNFSSSSTSASTSFDPKVQSKQTNIHDDEEEETLRLVEESMLRGLKKLFQTPHLLVSFYSQCVNSATPIPYPSPSPSSNTADHHPQFGSNPPIVSQSKRRGEGIANEIKRVLKGGAAASVYYFYVSKSAKKNTEKLRSFLTYLPFRSIRMIASLFLHSPSSSSPKEYSSPNSNTSSSSDGGTGGGSSGISSSGISSSDSSSNINRGGGGGIHVSERVVGAITALFLWHPFGHECLLQSIIRLPFEHNNDLKHSIKEAALHNEREAVRSSLQQRRDRLLDVLPHLDRLIEKIVKEIVERPEHEENARELTEWIMQMPFAAEELHRHQESLPRLVASWSERDCALVRSLFHLQVRYQNSEQLIELLGSHTTAAVVREIIHLLLRVLRPIGVNNQKSILEGLERLERIANSLLSLLRQQDDHPNNNNNNNNNNDDDKSSLGSVDMQEKIQSLYSKYNDVYLEVAEVVYDLLKQIIIHDEKSDQQTLKSLCEWIDCLILNTFTLFSPPPSHSPSSTNTSTNDNLPKSTIERNNFPPTSEVTEEHTPSLPPYLGSTPPPQQNQPGEKIKEKDIIRLLLSTCGKTNYDSQPEDERSDLSLAPLIIKESKEIDSYFQKRRAKYRKKMNALFDVNKQNEYAALKHASKLEHNNASNYIYPSELHITHSLMKNQHFQSSVVQLIDEFLFNALPPHLQVHHDFNQ